MIIVLGGGPAGRLAAMHLSHEGKEVVLVEGGDIGGTCLNFGCMVVCALNDAARTVNSAGDLYHLGVLDSYPVVEFPRLLNEMSKIQATIRKVLDNETRAEGVEIRYGEHAVLDHKTVRLSNECLEPDSVIAATGSYPALPDIPGIESKGVYSPHTLFSMDSLPKTMVILGGGVMAAEFAYIFSAFGCDVHLVVRSGMLKQLDPKQRVIALKELKGVHIHQDTCISGVNGDGKVSSVSLCSPGKSSEDLTCDAIFVAAGLLPRSGDLHGLEKGPMGEVLVNQFMETSVQGVYAAGDVTGPPYLTPVARHQGIIAAEHILGRKKSIDYRYFPQSVSLANEHAFCNPGSDAAVTLGLPGPAGPGTFWKVPFGDTGISRVSIEPDLGLIAGVSTSGPGAGIITSYISFLMQKGFTADDFADFLEVHPETDGVYSLIRYAASYFREMKEK